LLIGYLGASLANFDDQLKDPNPDEEQQPAFAKINSFINKKVFGVGGYLYIWDVHHLKMVRLKNTLKVYQRGFHPCHGSKFDMAEARFFKSPQV
jgi:ubiquinol-cytochrome c reductase iron-sulfur subunit